MGKEICKNHWPSGQAPPTSTLLCLPVFHTRFLISEQNVQLLLYPLCHDYTWPRKVHSVSTQATRNCEYLIFSKFEWRAGLSSQPNDNNNKQPKWGNPGLERQMLPPPFFHHPHPLPICNLSLLRLVSIAMKLDKKPSEEREMKNS